MTKKDFPTLGAGLLYNLPNLKTLTAYEKQTTN